MATLSAKEAAAKLGTDARTLRKFLRHQAKEAGGTVGVDTPGKGKRYALEAKAVTAMRKPFAAWAKEEAKRRAEALERKAAEAKAEAESDEDEVEVEADDTSE